MILRLLFTRFSFARVRVHACRDVASVELEASDAERPTKDAASGSRAGGNFVGAAVSDGTSDAERAGSFVSAAARDGTSDAERAVVGSSAVV